MVQCKYYAFYLVFCRFESVVLESALFGSLLSSSPGKVSVLFAFELLLNGSKKDYILITYTIVNKLWKNVLLPCSPG
jgi:hypothetical protein